MTRMFRCHHYRDIIATMMIITAAQSTRPPILRHNYGAVLKHIHWQIPTTADTFDLSITVNLQLDLPNDTLLTLTHNNDTSYLQNSIKIMFEKCSIVCTLIKTQYLNKIVRQKRAPLQIFGSVLQALFGLATDEEIESLQSDLGITEGNIIANKKYNIDRDTLILHLAKANNDVLAIISEHTRQAEAIFNTYFDNIRSVTNNITDTQIRLFQSFSHVEMVQAHILYYMLLQERYTYLVNTLIGLHALSQGSLTHKLLHPVTLTAALTTLASRLQLNKPPFKPYTMNTIYYYNHAASIQQINGSRVEINIKVPVLVHHKKAEAYEVIIFHIPLHSHDPSQKGHTVIDNAAKYLIIYPHTYALTDDISKTDSISEHPITFQTCTLALFHNNILGIKEHCSIKLFLTTFTPNTHVTLSVNEHIIVSTAPQFNLKCSDDYATINNTAMAIISIPCQCEYTSPVFIINTHNQICNQSHTFTFSRMAGFNLPAAQAFGLEIGNLLASTIHYSPIHLQIPATKYIFAVVNSKIELARQQGIDIQKAADLLANKDSHILDHIQNNLPAFGKLLHYGSSSISFFLSLVSLAISLFLFFRVQRLLAFITLAANVHGFINFTHHAVPPLMLRPINRTESKIHSQAVTNLDTATLSALILVAVAAVVIFRCVRRCKGKCYPTKADKYPSVQGPWLYLRLQYKKTIIDFPLLSMLHTVRSITTVASPKILAMHIKQPRFCRPCKLMITWTGRLVFRVMDEPITLIMPAEVPIARRMAAQLCKILKKSSYKTAMYMVDQAGFTQQIDSSTMHPYSLPPGIEPQEETPLQ